MTPKQIHELLPALSGTTLQSATSKLFTGSKWEPTLERYDPTLTAAADLCSAFVLHLEGGLVPPYWLTLSGVTGCGKTMLAEQTFLAARTHNPANQVGAWQTGIGVYNPKRRRPGSVWLQATDFADRVFQDRGFVEDLAIDFLVVIDDIGTAVDPTKRIAEALYRLANARLGKWTIYTTNHSLPEIAKQVDERVASRMIRDGNVFHRIAARDYAFRSKLNPSP